MKFTPLFAIVFCMAFYSCSADRTDETAVLPEYEFVIVDSLQIDHLEPLTLLDIHVGKELFLLSAENDNSLFLADKSGEIIAKFDEPGDSPTAFGNNTGSGAFFDDQLVIMGRTRFAVYDLDFNFQRGFKLPYSPSGMFYLGFDHLQSVVENGKTKLLAFTGGAQTETQSNQPAYYSEYNAFDLIDVDSGTFSPVVSFHPRSRFLSGEAYQFLQPKFHVDGNRLSFVYTNDSLLYSYDLNKGNSSFAAAAVPFDSFLLNDGFPMNGQPDYETKKGRQGGIWGYFKVGENHLIMYTSGIKLENMPDLAQEEEVLIEEIGRLDPLKWIVMDETGKSSLPQTPPIKYSIHIGRMDSEGYFWAPQNIYALEEELDLLTFYKLKLVQK